MRQGPGSRYRRHVAGVRPNVDPGDPGSSAVAAPSVRISASAHTLLMTAVRIYHAFATRISGSATGVSHAAGPSAGGHTPGVPIIAGQVTFGADWAKGGARPQRDALESLLPGGLPYSWRWCRSDRPRQDLPDGNQAKSRRKS
jgi:hypothetical protein